MNSNLCKFIYNVLNYAIINLVRMDSFEKNALHFMSTKIFVFFNNHEIAESFFVLSTCNVICEIGFINQSIKNILTLHIDQLLKMWWLTALKIIIWQHNMSFLSMHMKSGNRINSIRICGSQTIPFIRKRKQKLNSFWLFSHSHQKVNLRVAIILKGC